MTSNARVSPARHASTSAGSSREASGVAPAASPPGRTTSAPQPGSLIRDSVQANDGAIGPALDRYFDPRSTLPLIAARRAPAAERPFAVGPDARPATQSALRPSGPEQHGPARGRRRLITGLRIPSPAAAVSDRPGAPLGPTPPARLHNRRMSLDRPSAGKVTRQVVPARTRRSTSAGLGIPSCAPRFRHFSAAAAFAYRTASSRSPSGCLRHAAANAPRNTSPAPVLSLHATLNAGVSNT